MMLIHRELLSTFCEVLQSYFGAEVFLYTEPKKDEYARLLIEDSWFFIKEQTKESSTLRVISSDHKTLQIVDEVWQKFLSSLPKEESEK